MAPIRWAGIKLQHLQCWSCWCTGDTAILHQAIKFFTTVNLEHKLMSRDLGVSLWDARSIYNPDRNSAWVRINMNMVTIASGCESSTAQSLIVSYNLVPDVQRHRLKRVVLHTGQGIWNRNKQELIHWSLGDLDAILKMQFSILVYWLVS